MKDLIIILVIVSVIFGGSFLASKYYETSGDEIISILEDISKGIEKDSTKVKEEKVNKLKEEWDKKQKIWITLQYHETINEIENLLIECANYYTYDEEEDFNISFEKVKRSIEDLKNREEVSFLNIL